MSTTPKTEFFTYSSLRMIRLATMLLLALGVLAGCASGKADHTTFRDENMDFGSVRSVAILPFQNLTRESSAGDRVRDVLTTSLLATGGVYVIPPGEVLRGMQRAAIAVPSAPSSEEVVKLGGFVKAEAVITGVIKEYGEVRSGSSVANTISLSVQMFETQTGRIIWSANTTKGGIGVTDRLFGGGGVPMNQITQKAVDEIINKLFL
jgi:hypothetical protein